MIGKGMIPISFRMKKNKNGIKNRRIARRFLSEEDNKYISILTSPNVVLGLALFVFACQSNYT